MHVIVQNWKVIFVNIANECIQKYLNIGKTIFPQILILTWKFNYHRQQTLSVIFTQRDRATSFTFEKTVCHI